MRVGDIDASSVLFGGGGSAKLALVVVVGRFGATRFGYFGDSGVNIII